MDDALLPALLREIPVLIVVAIIGQWLAVRIDRVLDMHQKLIEKCFEDNQQEPPTPTA